jgi:hypothetical protein
MIYKDKTNPDIERMKQRIEIEKYIAEHPEEFEEE